MESVLGGAGGRTAQSSGGWIFTSRSGRGGSGASRLPWRRGGSSQCLASLRVEDGGALSCCLSGRDRQPLLRGSCSTRSSGPFPSKAQGQG